MEKGEAYHRKMTRGNVALLVVQLGIPTTVAMLITNIYNLVDTYFVGTLGTSQQAATGILFTLQAIIQAFAFLLGHGSGTHVAKKLAEKDVDGASSYVSTAFFAGLGIGVLLMTFGLIFLGPFMQLLGSSDTVLPYAKDYGMWVLISAPFLVASLVLNNILRYEGKALFAMIGIGSGALLNILGDYVFITIMGLEVFGAGMSTAISQIVSFVILFVFYRVQAQTKISIKKVSLQGKTYQNIFVSGLPSLIRQALGSISGGVLNNLTKPLGDAAVAAISVVNRASNFVMCVGLGVGQGFQPVAAYNYAAKEYDRVKKGCLFTLAFTWSVIGVLALLLMVLPNPIMSLFNPDPEVIRLGEYGLRAAGWGLLAMPISVLSNLTFQSIRKSWTATFLSTLRNGLIFIPTIFILVLGMGLGFDGIAWAQPISDILSSLISLPFLIVFLVRLPKTETPNEEVA